MTLGRRAAAILAGAAIVALGAQRGSAQGISIEIAATADSISPAPVMVVNASALPPAGQQATVTLELSTEGQFRSPFLVRSATGNTATFLVDRLLPERTRIFFRARLLDASGNVIAESVISHPVRSWLRLVDPIRATNDVLFTDQPRFVWSSPAITLPPGPWQYVITVTNSATNVPALALTVNDTVFVPSPLDACTSYRWSVRAIAVNGDASEQVDVAAPGTFVIQTAACPTATIFYQNFPNPFGRGARQPVTCFWFDLARTASVKLTIYDLRLREVKHLVPGPLGSTLPAGAYGRQNDVSQSGCDARLSWDGRDDAGHTVPPGVYVAVFDADGVHTVKKILFKGE
ncbi:MAG: hypothetical protein ACHQWU_06960 [Gemmatimonadales bacterium]|jgi:hypothetical protein